MKITECRNRGIFEVDDKFFEGIGVNEGTNLFAGMVVLDMNRNFMQGTRTYCAIHADFLPVAIGQITPKYKAVFDSTSATPTWVLEQIP